MAGCLKGKVTPVIGAGSVDPGWGSGKATAVAYGREEATVVCVDKNADAAAQTAGLVQAEGSVRSYSAPCPQTTRRRG